MTPLCAFDKLQSHESCNPNLFNKYQNHGFHTQKAKHILKQYHLPLIDVATHICVSPRPVTGGYGQMNSMG